MVAVSDCHMRPLFLVCVSAPDKVAVHDRGHRSAHKRLSVKRRIAASRWRFVDVVCPGDLVVENRHIAGGSGCERALFQTQNASRTRCVQLDHPLQCDTSGSHQMFKRERDCGLQPDDAEWASLKLLHLLAAGVGCMVSRQGIYSPRTDSCEQSRDVLVTA